MELFRVEKRVATVQRIHILVDHPIVDLIRRQCDSEGNNRHSSHRFCDTTFVTPYKDIYI